MRQSVVLISLIGLFSLSGCSMCPPGYLDDYAAVGGKLQRSDPTYGRVGSVFSDPGSGFAAATEPIDSPTNDEPVTGSDAYYDSGTMEVEEYYDDTYQGPGSYETYGTSTEYDDGVIVLGDEW